MAFPYAASFKLNSVTITPVGATEADLITDLVMRLDYFEDIKYPAVAAKMLIQDNANNMIASMPIQGYEKVTIKLQSSDEVDHEYNFRIYKVENRTSTERMQLYELGLVSDEALVNEATRVAKTLRGKPDEIVKEILQNYISTKKEIFTDKSVYNIIFQPGKKTPFSIINSLKSKSVPEGTSVKSKKKSSDKSDGTSKSDVAATDKSDYNTSGGTAGYFFYENAAGYHFKSIDSLCSTEKFNGTEPVAKYYQDREDSGSSGPDRKIGSISYDHEIDIMSKLRLGAYSSLIAFYNYSTGAYEEHVYSLADEYDNLGHMGSQGGLPAGQKELSQYPTRVMSVLLDHETWFDGAAVASPEEKDGADGNTSDFPDFQKHYISQSISRLNSLENQKVNISVPGNPSLMVGDKIEILIPNQIPTKDRTEQPYDDEHSGIYLISQVNHAFSPKEQKSTTHLTLIRDSYGRRESASKVK